MIKICFSQEITGLCQLLFIKTIAAYTSFGNYFTFELLLWSVFFLLLENPSANFFWSMPFSLSSIYVIAAISTILCFASSLFTCLIIALKPRKTINWQILYSVIHGQFCLDETYTRWILLSFTMMFLKRL